MANQPNDLTSHRAITRSALIVSFATVAVAIAMHLALLPQGQWYDEFFTFAFLRQYGAQGLVFRVLHWSPRPLSEALVYAYAALVHVTGRPLIAPVLAAAWAVPLAAMVAAAAPWRAPGRPARWALVLALPALFLLSGPVGELWYWPLGALAYLPALAAAAFATLILAGPGIAAPGIAAPGTAGPGVAGPGRVGLGRIAAVAAVLTAGALSAEIGAFAALILAPMLVLQGMSMRNRRGAWQAAAFAIPACAAALVLIFLLRGRAADTSVPVRGATYHHAIRSLAAALPHLATDLLGVGDTAGATIRTLASRALLAAGSWAALRLAWPAPAPRPPLLFLLAALGGAALLSIAGAYFTMGTLCCERHDAYRHALMILMVAATAALLPGPPAWARHPAAAPALLALAVLILMPVRAADILAEWRLGPVRALAKAVTFRSGLDAASDALDMPLPPDGPLLSAYHIEPGRYAMRPLPAWFVQGPMLFFGKRTMDVRRLGGMKPSPPDPPA